MEIIRIDSYDDTRFSRGALLQHGAFLADGVPCEILITGSDAAVIHCSVPDALDALIEEFRFYAEHISRFADESGHIVRSYPPVERFSVALTNIQPSQFYADADKVRAVRSFITAEEDVVIPLVQYEGRYLSLDGHTRMYAAHAMGMRYVTGFLTQCDQAIFAFAKEAQRRGITSPSDITLLPHGEYCIKWHGFCNTFFSELE